MASGIAVAGCLLTRPHRGLISCRRFKTTGATEPGLRRPIPLDTRLSIAASGAAGVYPEFRDDLSDVNTHPLGCIDAPCVYLAGSMQWQHLQLAGRVAGWHPCPQRCHSSLFLNHVPRAGGRACRVPIGDDRAARWRRRSWPPAWSSIVRRGRREALDYFFASLPLRVACARRSCSRSVIAAAVYGPDHFVSGGAGDMRE